MIMCRSVPSTMQLTTKSHSHARVSEHEGAAVDPEHDGEVARGGGIGRHVHGEEKTVLVADKEVGRVI